MLRRKIVLLGSAGLVADALGAAVRSQPQRCDLTGYRQTFAAEFNDPRLPLSVHDGGPFTTRYEQWGGYAPCQETKNRSYMSIRPSCLPRQVPIRWAMPMRQWASENRLATTRLPFEMAAST